MDLNSILCIKLQLRNGHKKRFARSWLLSKSRWLKILRLVLLYSLVLLIASRLPHAVIYACDNKFLCSIVIFHLYYINLLIAINLQTYIVLYRKNSIYDNIHCSFY